MSNVKPGRLTGIIRDDNNQPVSGVTISVEKEKKGTSTSVSGDYLLTLPPGNYTIVITAVGFESRRIGDIVIRSNAQTDLSLTLSVGKRQTLESVIVTSSARRESARGLLQAQKNNASMTDGISAEQMTKTPDVNTAQVLKRVSGVTVQGDKFVTIRGVSDRYNNVLINGSTLPSTEPNRRNFSFDIVPSALVDNVIVNKTATPDLSAEFTGGIVQINTKDVPIKNFLDIALGTGINTESVNKDFTSFKRDIRASLGKIDADRKWFGDGRVFDQEKYSRDYISGNTTVLRQVGSQIPNRWQQYNYRYIPVQNYQLSGGLTRRFSNGNAIGMVAAVTYLNEQFFEKGEARSLQVYEAASSRSRNNTTIGSLLNAAYKTKKHKIAWKNLYNLRYNNQFDSREGYNQNTGNERRFSDVTISSKMFQTRLEAEHLITNKNLKLDWYTDYVKLIREQPDSRFLLSGPPFGYGFNFNDRNINFGGIFSSVLSEHRNNAGLNISLPFMINGDKQLIKAGYAFSNRKADYDATSLRIIANAATISQTGIGSLPYYQIVTAENIGNGNLTYIPTYAKSFSTGDKYEGTQNYMQHMPWQILNFSKDSVLSEGSAMNAIKCRWLPSFMNR
ncbi:MAG: carboxypeptidase regulatory-like domain-containing protein [Chitinophagaceae bacterium]